MTEPRAASARKPRSKSKPTIAELVFYLPTEAERRDLEDFRIEWEKTNGPIDLTRRYTSLLPVKSQDFLVKSDPKRYFDGLPAFVQAYFRDIARLLADDGQLDQLPDSFLQLYLNGQMGTDGPGR